ncbi:aspartate/glutamate racemase family protein [Paenarthrobacter sp. NPDC089322]|uniref:aspartate/glutamate racemase family protein n=1 Tax=Paenarthrobacter sp. NPDC089322 TaxID=3155065 RepID=UPI00342ED3D2
MSADQGLKTTASAKERTPTYDSPPHQLPRADHRATAGLTMSRTPLLAMLHTVPGLVTDMEHLAWNLVPRLRVLHFVDESLLQDTIAEGTAPGHVRRRLVAYARYAEESGAHALLVSCSSVGEAATAAQDFVSIPVLRIDTPMADLAVASGHRIGVLATLSATLGPTTRLVQDSAKKQNKKPHITAVKAEGAFDALRAGNRELHDSLVLDSFAELAADCDVVVLAQASMARAIEHIRDRPGGPVVLASPDSGMTQLSALFGRQDQ